MKKETLKFFIIEFGLPILLLIVFILCMILDYNYFIK